MLEAGPAGNHIDNSFLEGLAVDGFVSLGSVCRLVDVMDLATEFLAAPVGLLDSDLGCFIVRNSRQQGRAQVLDVFPEQFAAGSPIQSFKEILLS